MFQWAVVIKRQLQQTFNPQIGLALPIQKIENIIVNCQVTTKIWYKNNHILLIYLVFELIADSRKQVTSKNLVLTQFPYSFSCVKLFCMLFNIYLQKFWKITFLNIEKFQSSKTQFMTKILDCFLNLLYAHNQKKLPCVCLYHQLL